MGSTSEPGLVAAAAAVRTVNHEQLRVADDTLCWVATRPADNGRSTVVRWRPGSGPTDLTPPGAAVRSRVHVLGGGAYAVTGDTVWYTTPEGLYRRVEGGASELVSTAILGGLVATDNELLGVRETDRGDALVAVPLAGSAEPRVLAESAGFFGTVRPGPGLLAWSWWSGRDTPWDGCELWVASYEPGGLIGDPMKLAGGPDESAVEPRWGPDGALYYLSDRTGWWNLYRWDGLSVAPMTADCAAPPVELGQSSYDLLTDGRVVLVAQEGPRQRLFVVEPGGEAQPVPLPYASIGPSLVAWGRSVALVGAAPGLPSQVALVHLDGPEPRVEVLTGADPDTLTGAGPGTPAGPPPERPSAPAPSSGGPSVLRVPVGRDREVEALVHPPTTTGAGDPPVVVRVTAGPTGSGAVGAVSETDFFTGQGFTVVDVAAAGSPGYGRAFRQSIHGRWGLVDVDDCRAVAQYLLALGHAAPGRVFIRGVGVAGHTALHAVAQDGPFSAATAVSAVVDPDHWAATAPRFHRAYADRLRGGAGPVRAEDVRAPVLLVHGTADEVVTVSDVRRFAAELAERGVPHGLLLLDGVGHQVDRSGRADEALVAEVAHYRARLRETGRN